MKSIIINLILIIIFISNAKSQNIQIIWQNTDFKKVYNSEQFEYLDKQFDVSSSIKVATIKTHGTNSGKTTLNNIFNSLWENANKLGANSFKIDEFYLSKALDTMSINLTFYFTKKKLLDENAKLYPQNMIYVIGDLERTDKGKNFKFNDNEINLMPLEFVSYQNQVGQEATISIGGFFLGAKLCVIGKEKRLPKHLSLNGFGVGPANFGHGQIGISFNTGRIYPVDLNFGQFLVHILREKKIN